LKYSRLTSLKKHTLGFLNQCNTLAHSCFRQCSKVNQ
jgi:hypothetical protein